VEPSDQHCGLRHRATPGWHDLPAAAQIYVAAIIVSGSIAIVHGIPRNVADPVLFAGLALVASITAAWKVTLPLRVVNGSTLSVSDAANLMALLLLGAQYAILIAAAAVWIQCVYKPRQPYPLHRTAFSAAAGALTMSATSLAFLWLGGLAAPLTTPAVILPIVGAVTTYFLVNTGLIAAAIAFSSGTSCAEVWRRGFLWTAPSFAVAGTVGAIAAAIVQRGHLWNAVMLVAPLYVTYRAYASMMRRREHDRGTGPA
jgi:hypothetical protein